MKKSLIVVLSSVTLLTSCNIGQNSNSSFKIDEIEIVDKVMDKLDLLKSSEVNYTLNVIDYGGNFSLSFSSGVYTYKDLDSGKMEGYIEDNNGIYGFNISRDGVFSEDYYEVDNDGNNLHSLYDNLYTFKDVDIDYENIYDEDDRVYFSNLNNDYCKILFSLAGYSVDSTYAGMSFNDVESMYFTIDSNSNLQLAVAFNESTSGRGTTIMTVENIGSTVQDQKIIEYIGTNNGALLLYAHYHNAGHLIGVDIFKEPLELANDNLKRYTDDYELINSRIQDLDIEPVDVVICNPPFFEMGNVRSNKFYKTAMFEETLPLDDMFKAFRKNMKDNGEVYTLYPACAFWLGSGVAGNNQNQIDEVDHWRKE